MSSVKTDKRKNSKSDSVLLLHTIDIFTFLILCLFPLFVMDRYYNILQAKYYFYVGAVVLLVVAVIFVGCIEHNKLEQYFTSFKWNEFIRKFSVTDVALLVFLIIAGISTISSDYVYESFWGNEGRYSGFFLLCLYGVAYFCVTRFGKLKTWYLDAFLIANLFVCIFGITDYFKMDLLHFKVGMLEEQKFMFTSTIGNINTYTALVGMVTAVSAVLFATENKWKKQCFYFASLVISFFALIMGISDNAYLSLAALFGLLPLYLFKDKKGVKSYLMMLAAFFSVIQCIDWINAGMGDRVLGIDSAFNIIVKYDGLLLIVILLWVICIVAYGLDYANKKKKKQDADIHINDSEENEKKWTGCGVLRIIWLAIVIICVLGVGYALFDVNVQGNTERYGAFGGYLLFNDDWGTHRGYIWRNAMECFEQFPMMKKVFGFGPDTFGIVLLDKTQGNIYGEIFDNAHNEYLHYLITVGITGLIAYLVFIISFIVRVIRKAGKNQYIVAVFFAVICYSIQAFVNLNLPIATPIMWMMLMLGVLGCSDNDKQKIRKTI